MKLKLLTLMLSMITLSSFACQPKTEDQKATNTKKVLQIKSCWQIANQLANQGLVHFVDDQTLAERVGSKQMTQEELDTVILEETQNDPCHNSDTIRQEISLIIRMCPDYVRPYRSEPTMPLYSNFEYDPSETWSK
jgi:hypothetical protein